jgi:hypothetical protein
VIDTADSKLRAAVVGMLRALGPLRFVGHMLTPYTVVVGWRR